VNSAPKQPSWQVSNKLRSRARSLRRDSTDAEQIIWNALRAHRLNEAAFRRQTPIGPYVADFVCHASGLVIELDGGQHFESEQMKRDVRRDTFLASKGFRVLRFNNHDVMANREGVLETIAAALASTPSPSLPRKRGRESRPALGLRRARGGSAS
jgi:very-short-patch-repair endonuclease